MTSYAPLERFLADQMSTRLRLSFEDVERVLGAPLPRSARLYQPWWANTETHSQARAWMRKGWRTEAVDVPGEKLTFVRLQGRAREDVRKADPPGDDASVVAVIRLDQLGPSAKWYIPEVQAQFGVEDLAEAVSIALEIAGRRALIDRAAAQSTGMTSDSVDLVRELRDSR